ncbi:hypothetical protein FSARC_7673 [Fusarium sarcochroum]|uniref:Uncharacterized protein n=1 Tax=Fusarium sarcochroum TaxID=1208366 RepID=A0A8H4TUJ1_9HYPO|nr:hypothetical protein FSARC_7673 [Fusarium sarcochroum]
MKFFTALVALASASAAMAAAAPTIDESKVELVSREVIEGLEARQIQCFGCQNGRRCCLLRGYPKCTNC